MQQFITKERELMSVKIIGTLGVSEIRANADVAEMIKISLKFNELINLLYILDKQITAANKVYKPCSDLKKVKLEIKHVVRKELDDYENDSGGWWFNENQYFSQCLRDIFSETNFETTNGNTKVDPEIIAAIQENVPIEITI